MLQMTEPRDYWAPSSSENLEVKSDENVEPDSTSDQPSLKPQKNESKPEPEDEQNVQPDSTTTDKMITNGEISGWNGIKIRFYGLFEIQSQKQQKFKTKNLRKLIHRPMMIPNPFF